MERAGPGAEEPVQTAAEGRRLDLAAVTGADGGHGGRIEDAGLEGIDLAEELEVVHVEEGRGQSEGTEDGLVEQALVGQVMDGEDRPRPAEKGVAGIRELEIGEGEGRLPIVGVDDIGGEAEGPHGLQGGPTEEAEALPVVRIVARRRPVQMVPVEIVRPVDEIRRDAVGAMGQDAIGQCLAVHFERGAGR